MLALCTFAAYSGSAATEQWQGGPGVSATTNWTDAANWTSPQQTYYNQVQFTPARGQAPIQFFSVNNVFDSGLGRGPDADLGKWTIFRSMAITRR